jgi:anti-sigma-K factor RskA
MKYTDPQLRRALSAEYALGTLTGRPRRRFQRLLAGDPALQQEVAYWENRLAALTRGLAPIRPRAQVWVEIARKTGGGALAAEAALTATPAISPAPKEPVVGRVEGVPPPANDGSFWRTWASMATAAAILLGFALVQRVLNVPTPQPSETVAIRPETYVALLQMPNSTMHWTLAITPGRGQMTAAAGGEPPPLEGHSPELWWLSPDGPVAIGVLPTSGGGTMKLPKEFGAEDGIKLAVSIEPAGGSPTGKPTGPVVVVTEAVKTA